MPSRSVTASIGSAIGKADLEALREGASLRITDKVRALALGVVAFSWAVMSADKLPVSQINLSHHVWLLATVSLSVLSLLLDLLQSLGNYILFNGLRHKMERDGKETGQFDSRSCLYRCQSWAFTLKIAFCIISCVSVLILVAVSL